MKIHNECTFLKEEGLAKIEQKYNAKYVFETCIKDKTGAWCNFPVAIFYTEQAHPQGSNYLALYHNGIQFMIADGITATEEFSGLQIGDDVIYSRYRHNYNGLNGAYIDGGRDYVRYSPDLGNLVKLKVNKDKLEVIND